MELAIIAGLIVLVFVIERNRGTAATQAAAAPVPVTAHVSSAPSRAAVIMPAVAPPTIEEVPPPIYITQNPNDATPGTPTTQGTNQNTPVPAVDVTPAFLGPPEHTTGPDFTPQDRGTIDTPAPLPGPTPVLLGGPTARPTLQSGGTVAIQNYIPVSGGGGGLTAPLNPGVLPVATTPLPPSLTPDAGGVDVLIMTWPDGQLTYQRPNGDTYTVQPGPVAAQATPLRTRITAM